MTPEEAPCTGDASTCFWVHLALGSTDVCVVHDMPDDVHDAYLDWMRNVYRRSRRVGAMSRKMRQVRIEEGRVCTHDDSRGGMFVYAEAPPPPPIVLAFMFGAAA